MCPPAWQVSIYPEKRKTKDVGKGQRKGILNYQKGRGCDNRLENEGFSNCADKEKDRKTF